jgi:hypothetical protein
MYWRGLTINTLLVVFLLSLALAVGCEDNQTDENVAGPELAPTGQELLGLKDGRRLDYLVTDTTIEWPSLEISVDSGTQVIRISKDNNEWTIHDDSVPIISLQMSSPSVLHNGYWRTFGESVAKVFFPEPAISIQQASDIGKEWGGYVAPYTSDTSESNWIFHVGYFGYYYTKKFLGMEQIQTEGWTGKAYKYEAKIYRNADDLNHAAIITEFYAPGVGLVMQLWDVTLFKRVLSLRDYT